MKGVGGFVHNRLVVSVTISVIDSMYGLQSDRISDVIQNNLISFSFYKETKLLNDQIDQSDQS